MAGRFPFLPVLLALAISPGVAGVGEPEASVTASRPEIGLRDAVEGVFRGTRFQYVLRRSGDPEPAGRS